MLLRPPWRNSAIFRGRFWIVVNVQHPLGTVVRLLTSTRHFLELRSGSVQLHCVVHSRQRNANNSPSEQYSAFTSLPNRGVFQSLKSCEAPYVADATLRLLIVRPGLQSSQALAALRMPVEAGQKSNTKGNGLASPPALRMPPFNKRTSAYIIHAIGAC